MLDGLKTQALIWKILTSKIKSWIFSFITYFQNYKINSDSSPVDFEISGLVSYSGEGLEKLSEVNLEGLDKSEHLILEKDLNKEFRLLSGKEKIRMFYEDKKKQI